MAEHGGLETPMSSPFAKDLGPSPSEGNFYGPNMPNVFSQHSPTPGDQIPEKVQFAPGGFAPGPLDSPFTTAYPVGSKGGEGDSHGADTLDSPMTSKVQKGY